MVATHYVWDPEFDCITKEIDAAGAVTARYTQEPKIYGGLISQNRSGATSIYHYDAIGTTRALTDSSQNVTDTAVYTAFGEKSASTGSTANAFGFTGQLGYYTSELSLSPDVRRRKYSPQRARWLTKDPLDTKANQDGGEYLYCRNLPSRRIDPSGLQSLCVCVLTKTVGGKWKAEALGGTWQAPVLSTNPGPISATPVTQITCRKTRRNSYIFTCRKCQPKGGNITYPLTQVIDETYFESGVSFPSGIVVVGVVFSIPIPGGGLLSKIISNITQFVAGEWVVGFAQGPPGSTAAIDIDNANNRCAEEDVYTGSPLYTTPQGDTTTLPAFNKGYSCDSIK